MKRAVTLELGGTPRALLLPQSVREERRGRRTVRKLATAAVALTVLAGLATAGASAYAGSRQSALAAEQARSTDLVAQQLEFADARRMSNQIELLTAARMAATVTEIDWKAYLDEVSATLPAGVTLTTVAVEQSGDDAEAEADAPLKVDSVATISIAASSLNIPDVEAWLDDLAGITGFAGIAPPATVTGSENGGYLVTLELLVNDEAYLGRYQPEEEG